MKQCCLSQGPLSWVILVFATISLYLLAGKRRGFGVFVAQLQSQYNATISLTEINWIGDVYSGLSHVLTILITPLVLCFNSSHRYRIFQILGASLIAFGCLGSAWVPNPHYLFLSYSVVDGLGSAIVYCVAGMIVVEYFDKKHSFHIFATTILSGNSLAALIFVGLYSIIFEKGQWRTAFAVIGVFYFIVLFIASISFIRRENDVEYTNIKEENGTSSAQNEDETLTNFLRRSTMNSVVIIVWGLERIFCFIVAFSLLMNLITFILHTTDDFSESTKVLNLYLTGEVVAYVITAVFSALTKSLLTNKLGYILLVTSILEMIILFVWSNYITNVIVSMSLAFCSGIMIGPSISFQFPAGEELTGLNGQIAYTFTVALSGVGILAAPMFSALISERFSDSMVFFVLGIMMALKVMCLLILCLNLTHGVCKTQHTKQQKQPSVHTPILGDKENENKHY